MKARLAVIKGDGIGLEIIDATLRVLRKIEQKFSHEFECKEVLMGGAALDAVGEPLPDETLSVCKNSDAVLFGAIGGAKWDKEPPHKRPEAGLLRLRKELGLFANLRPATLFPQLANSSPLKAEILSKGIDFVMVRELIGGIYFGKHERFEQNGETNAQDLLVYSTSQITQISRLAFKLANARKKHLVCVDKANVLESSRLWREVVQSVAKAYPAVRYEFMLVDNAAMQLCKNPSQFDVILTENMFGDILSDEASVLTGSLGVLPSASLRGDKFGLYEPIHGSAPDIAGKDLANPIGAILSLAMLLELSLGLINEANAVRSAINSVLDKGQRTADLMSEGCEQVGCVRMSELICEAL
ncbi:3-isopropylmalate dehydrogenase [Campylobacter troglodytis]|uniref:3-isopropylmalate dehydrogenase n=1 Tax=Campylobacter troglodytis TaxID=654363 RepID=UPI0011593292|nr:3-isopropylmalate dehydrogenase [Campylobacter troglodytis]TQR60507.1 3-isopropylmalate dehydrogenase [Campylobacter troglodytis]